MNTKQQNVLRSLLKKYKFKSVSNMVRQALGINFENFLQNLHHPSHRFLLCRGRG